MAEVPVETAAPAASKETIPVLDTPGVNSKPDATLASQNFAMKDSKPKTYNYIPDKTRTKIPSQRAQTASKILLVLKKWRLFKRLRLVSVSTLDYNISGSFLSFASRGGIVISHGCLHVLYACAVVRIRHVLATPC